MSEVKHTPGPWTFDGPSDNIIVWGAKIDARVCFLTSTGPTEANARLIVAAPELLEALEDFCLSAECAAGVDDGADLDTASSLIMSSMGSAMAVSYDKARVLIADATPPQAQAPTTRLPLEG